MYDYNRASPYEAPMRIGIVRHRPSVKSIPYRPNPNRKMRAIAYCSDRNASQPDRMSFRCPISSLAPGSFFSASLSASLQRHSVPGGAAPHHIFVIRMDRVTDMVAQFLAGGGPAGGSYTFSPARG